MSSNDPFLAPEPVHAPIERTAIQTQVVALLSLAAEARSREFNAYVPEDERNFAYGRSEAFTLAAQMLAGTLGDVDQEIVSALLGV